METYRLQSGLKTAAGCSVRVVGRVLGYTAIGLTINIIFIVILTPEISSLSHSPSATVERGVAVPLEGIGYALVWVGKNTIPLVLYLVFAIGFTLAYFLIGKKQGVASALNYAFNSNKLASEHAACRHEDADLRQMAERTTNGSCPPSSARGRPSVRRVMRGAWRCAPLHA